MELKDLKNVGKATLEDLHLLGIHHVEELADRDPTDLFHRLERLSNKRHDPCVWDVFAAIIHEAQTGERSAWWIWTKKRKALEQLGKWTHAI